jgi:hypothetical protein
MATLQWSRTGMPDTDPIDHEPLDTVTLLLVLRPRVG